MTLNPYESPRSVDPAPAYPAAALRVRRRLCTGILAATVLASLVYTYWDEVFLKTSLGAWPLLIGTSVISIAAAVTCRDSFLAPLCCLLPTLTGTALAGLLRNWHYAQMHLAIPLGLAFSLPALGIVLVLRLRSSSLGSPTRLK